MSDELFQRIAHTLAQVDRRLSRIEVGESGTLSGITLNEVASTPGTPTAGSAAHIYIKGDTFIVQWNESGTPRYLSILLTGTGTTWTHGTAAP